MKANKILYGLMLICIGMAIRNLLFILRLSREVMRKEMILYLQSGSSFFFLFMIIDLQLAFVFFIGYQSTKTKYLKNGQRKR